jgi:hypothetical protein
MPSLSFFRWVAEYLIKVCRVSAECLQLLLRVTVNESIFLVPVLLTITLLVEVSTIIYYRLWYGRVVVEAKG